MLKQEDWENIADEYKELQIEKATINYRMQELRGVMFDNLPKNIDTIETPVGNIIRYSTFIKWELSKELNDKIQEERKNGTATKIKKEIVSLRIKQNK